MTNNEIKQFLREEAARRCGKVYRLIPKNLGVDNSAQPANTINGVTFEQLMRSLSGDEE